MIGGPDEAVAHSTRSRGLWRPASGRPTDPRPRGRPDTADQGHLHCGIVGEGHLVRMVHNGIEYGIMAANAEGLDLLHHANAGMADRAVDAGTSPPRDPVPYQYRLDLAAIAEPWRRGRGKPGNEGPGR